MTGASALAHAITALPCSGRRLVALAGPPASGKSTLARNLVAVIGVSSRLVPMDGFHLDNRLLDAKDLCARKGAPETFDLGGLLRLLPALRHEERVYFPTFDRARDVAVAGAGEIDATVETVIIEGNYLMFDQPGWRDLASHWDGCLFLEASPEVLRDRLMKRWRGYGLDETDARERTDGNDLVNATRILRHRLRLPVEFPPWS